MEEGYYEVDLAGNFTFVNDAMCRLQGSSRDELMGTNNRDYMTPETAKDVYEAFNNVYTTGEPERNLEWVTIRPDGSKWHVETSISLVKNPADEHTGFRGVVRDVTERKQAEEALRVSEEKLRTITASAQDAIVLMDEKGDVSYWNPAAERIFGYSSREILRRPLHEIIVPERYHEAYRNGFERFKKDGQGSAIGKLLELEALKKDGTEFPVELSLSSVNANGKWNAIGIVRDISERRQMEADKKRLEDQLQQSQKMEAIGTLSGGIAHDFNNILGIIVGNTEMALADTPETSPVHGNLSAVRKASMRARDIVKQILSFSRQKEQTRGSMELGTVVVESLRLLRSIIPTTIDIRQNISNDIGITSGDPSQINQILLNLCTNAGYAMKETGGILEVSLANVTLSDAESSGFPQLSPGDYVKLTVSDNGNGIAPDKIDRIFDPYFTTKAIGEGTGMGLSVAHGIIANHGGAITVSSEVGRGTTFDVLFPVVAQDLQAETVSEDAIAGGDECILLVDDEPEMVKIYQSMLERLGYTVAVRTSSIEALEAFKARPDRYDLIITDQTMPHLTGQMLAREMMAIRPDIPIILCTGHSDLIESGKAKAMGIQAFVMKPVIMRQLAGTIRDILDDGDHQIIQ